MSMDYNEVIAFVVRETGWSLEYIGGLEFLKLQVLVDELKYQRDMEEYNRNRVMAMMITCWTKDTKVEDIIGPSPVRSAEEEHDIWKLAEQAGIRIPSQRA